MSSKQEVTKPDANRRRKYPAVEKESDGSYTVVFPQGASFNELFGFRTDDAAHGLMSSALDKLRDKGSRCVSFMAALPSEIEPRDAIEGMLCVPTGTTHVALVTFTQHLLHAKTFENSESIERTVARFSRTYTAQMEALRKHRTKGQQTVCVERVTANEGGQAIVLNLSHEGGGDGKNRPQLHRPYATPQRRVQMHRNGQIDAPTLRQSF